MSSLWSINSYIYFVFNKIPKKPLSIIDKCTIFVLNLVVNKNYCLPYVLCTFLKELLNIIDKCVNKNLMLPYAGMRTF